MSLKPMDSFVLFLFFYGENQMKLFFFIES